ncbi:MAG: peptidoglycan-binding protein [Kiloniellales bacterium]
MPERYHPTSGTLFTLLIALCAAALVFASPTAGLAGEALNIVRSDDPAALPFNLVKRLQIVLTENGYEPGPVDGIMGPKTAAALKAYQAANGLVPDGRVGEDTLQSLGLLSP